MVDLDTSEEELKDLDWEEEGEVEADRLHLDQNFARSATIISTIAE